MSLAKKIVLAIGAIVSVLIVAGAYLWLFEQPSHTAPREAPREIKATGDKIVDAIHKAAEYLRIRQEDSGHFSKGALAPKPAFTALVVDALGITARVELLKGRNHYLCRAEYEKMSRERLIAPSIAMEKLWQWAERTETGDRGELTFSPRSDDWEALDADADDCIGEYCSRFADCFFFMRRDAARFADMVVVNHALFFLDLAIGGGLLPQYDCVVLDEARPCGRYATAALTASLSPAGVGRR